MLRFEVSKTSGERLGLTCVLTARLDSEEGVPADSLAVTCPFDERLRNGADFIFAYDGNTLVFKGQIDEISVVSNADGAVIRLSARSLAGALLDNEAEPITYINPASSMIFERHAKGFGFDEYDADEAPFNGRLRIDKGMTHWQVIEAFCINRYGKAPRVSGSGKLLFRGQKTDKTIRFGADGISYVNIKESRVRCKPISRVKLKLSDFGTYSSYIDNENPESRFVRRERFVDVSADNTTISTADNMIKKSNSDSYSVTFECVGCYFDTFGCRAELCDRVLGRIGGLAVRRVCTKLDSRGWTTTFVLQKEEF